MVRVKICGLTCLEDARWAWKCGADLLGFVLVGSSPRYVGPEPLAEITRALLAEGCQARLVGVFAGEPAELLRDVVRDCSLGAAQLHGDLPPGGVGAIGVPVIRALAVRETVEWGDPASNGAWAVLLDGHAPGMLGGTGRTWRWDLLRAAPRGTPPIIVAGGLTPDNVAAAIREARPWGVDVSSGVESAPGRKDPVRVDAFIRRAKEARAAL